MILHRIFTKLPLKDTNMHNSYTVINASAGSGKTYALVQRLLLICLGKPHQHQLISNILALTFTNKAANEMKKRILDWLQAFTQEDFATNNDLIALQTELQKQGEHPTLEDLHHRAKRMLDYVLHNYSTVNIGTIDKFNSRLVRSFSYELGLAKNFNLEINNEPFLMEAVDQLLDKIGDDAEISDSLLDFVNYGLENDRRINLNSTLYNSAKEFVKDIHYENLKNNKDFNHENYKLATSQLRADLRDLKAENKKAAKEALAMIQENGLETEDFSGGKTQSIAVFFENLLYKDATALCESEEKEEKKLTTYAKGASAKSKSKEGIIFGILDDLLEQRLKIIRNHVIIQKKEKILAALLPLKVNNDIQHELEKIEEDNDVVLLSKFNILIHENLKDEPSPFIYEKIGAKFSHYFFDEFQDTSALQWQNFIPLRDHSVASEGTSFTVVGDPKQSIYRFRGGDSQLMLDIINHQEKSPKDSAVVNLEYNWRSARHIVDFNNDLYRHISGSMRDSHKSIFGDNARQKHRQKFNGRVRVNLIENATAAEFFEDTAEKMSQDIQQLIHSGFRFSDITILCRGNQDIFNFSQILGNMQVEYLGEWVAIKTISESGLTLELSGTLLALMEFLRWEVNPNNLQHLVLMMYHLNQTGRINMSDFTAEIQEVLACKDRTKIRDFIHNKYALELSHTALPRLNLYHYIEYFLQEFSIDGKETDFLLNFLEVVYGFTQNPGAHLKDFIIFWEDEARKKSIQASENIDAIRMMTVHKAKGLEFPAVLYPMQNKHKDYEFSDWFSTDSGFGLQSVNTSYFSKELAVYDEQIRAFNSENEYRNYIDRICVQYVATTRPVEQLYLYLQKPAKTNYLEVLEFVNLRNPRNADEFDYYEDFDVHKQSAHHDEPAKTEAIVRITEGTRSAGQAGLQIATPSRSYQNRNEQVRQGIFIHEILSKINSDEDVDFVLESYVLEGILTVSEKAEIAIAIHRIVENHPRYFGKHLQVISERDIMLSENDTAAIYRPDRLIKNHEGFLLADFKTGAERDKHRTQIEEYRTVLEKLGYTVLSAEVVYV